MTQHKKTKKQNLNSKHKHRRATKAKQGRRFLQSHWSYLPLLLIVATGLVINHLLPDSSHHVLGLTTDISPSLLLSETNQQRALDHEKPLTLNTQLTNAAQAKADNMVADNYWAHNSPSGQTPWSFMTAAGYQYQSAGENLAYGFTTTQALMSGWMHSTEHRDNILDANYQSVGFGIVNATNYQGQGPETVVDAMYGQPASVIVASATSNTSSALPANIITSTPAASTISRLQLFANTGSSWMALLLVAVASALLTILVIKHAIKWRRVLVHGEKFIL
ncbi:MAG: CAP domain-containing protein, partial [Candidatus Saccharimonadales bacterium]